MELSVQPSVACPVSPGMGLHLIIIHYHHYLDDILKNTITVGILMGVVNHHGAIQWIVTLDGSIVI